MSHTGELLPLSAAAPRSQHPRCVNCRGRMDLIAPGGMPHRWWCIPCWVFAWARHVRVVYEVHPRRGERAELVPAPLPPPRPRYRLPRRPRPKPQPRSFSDWWRAWCIGCRVPMKSVDDVVCLPHWRCGRCYAHVTKRPWQLSAEDFSPPRPDVLPLEAIKGLYWIPDPRSPDPLQGLLDVEAVEGVVRRLMAERGIGQRAACAIVAEHL